VLGEEPVGPEGQFTFGRLLNAGIGIDPCRAYGKRRVNDTVAVTRTDRFHLGSDTKAMTAVLAATFVQEGKLEWTSTLRELFPDLKTMHESYYKVTLAELLAHKSGLTGSIAGDHPDVWGRLWKNDGPVPMAPGFQADNPPAMGPAGTVHCSLPDWGLLVADQLAGLRGKGRLLKKAAAYKELHPADEGYAFGWGVTSRDWAGGETWSLSGSNTMWYAIAWVSPATDRFYLGATNVAAPTTSIELDKAFGPMIAKYGKRKPG
jgi:hypothetical protein